MSSVLRMHTVFQITARLLHVLLTLDYYRCITISVGALGKVQRGDAQH